MITLPLLGIALLVIAVTMFLHTAPTVRPALAVATTTPEAVGVRHATPFGSGAALRNLLY